MRLVWVALVLAAGARAEESASSKFRKACVAPTLKQVESAAHGVAAPGASFGPAAEKAAGYVKRFVDPIADALEFQASKAAAALGSADPNASVPPEPALEFPDPIAFLKKTFLSAPEVAKTKPGASEPLAKEGDFTYKPPPEKRGDSTKFVRGRAGASRPRLKPF